MTENMSKYNTRVRQRMSDEYVSALKRRAELIRERNKLLTAMASETITHVEYLNIEKQAGQIKVRLVQINAEIDIWDKAREICLEVTDEV